MTIRILDSNVATQIAAGEVIERPASVVRELIENALDAGAQRIVVEVRGGGLRELRVQDDGSGIPADQVELAFQRHATSKLNSADDLWSIGTLGFRGEALPAIASVAQVVCMTRSAGQVVGLELRIAGGEVQGRTPVGSPIGMDISVRNLFYNTPVRREFLRSEASEATAVATTVTQYALAYPEVRFTLSIDGRQALQTTGDGDLQGVLIELYGLDITRQLLPVDLQQGEGQGIVTVRGLISPPGVTRSSRSALHLFINRRVVQPRGALAIVVEEAYHSLLIKGRHPLAVLNISIPPAAVDVNIHPTKSEVKFRDAPRVLAAVGRAVRDSLLASGAPLWDADQAPEAFSTAQRRFELRQIGGDWGQAYQQPSMPMAAEGGSPGTQPPSGWQIESAVPGPRTDLSAALPLPAVSIERLRILGQAQHAYIIADAPEGLALIDQHAAHERILYERLHDLHAAHQIEAQQLQEALTVDLRPEDQDRILAHTHDLADWGFLVEDFGMALRVRAIPTGLAVQQVPTILSDIATALGQTSSTQPLWDETLLTILAGHLAIPAGQLLSLEEMQSLILELSRCRTAHRCPHGLPTIALLNTNSIEQQFAGPQSTRAAHS